MTLSTEYLNSVCEIKTIENEVVATGVLRSITEDYIEIVAKVGRFPITQYGISVKINIFNARLGFKVLVGDVFTSSLQFMRVVNLIALVDYERRHFFRIDTNIKTNLYLLQEDKTELELPIRIDNISLCGVGFFCEQKLPQGQRLQLRLRLMQKICTLNLDIIRQWQESETGVYQYGCQFLNIRNADADILCAFIFERQREQISRQRQ